MQGNAIRMLSGADSARGANEYLKAVQERRDAWPYVHVYAPPNATDVMKISIANVQMAAAPAIEILQYTVNAGKVFYLQAVLFSASTSIARRSVRHVPVSRRGCSVRCRYLRVGSAYLGR